MVGFVFILVSVGVSIIFGEPMSAHKVIGLLVILVGIAIASAAVADGGRTSLEYSPISRLICFDPSRCGYRSRRTVRRQHGYDFAIDKSGLGVYIVNTANKLGWVSGTGNSRRRLQD